MVKICPECNKNEIEDKYLFCFDCFAIFSSSDGKTFRYNHTTVIVVSNSVSALLSARHRLRSSERVY